MPEVIDVISDQVSDVYGSDASGDRGLFDASRNHWCRDAETAKKVLVTGVPGYNIVVKSVTARTRFFTEVPLGETGTTPFVFALSYEGGEDDLLRGIITQSTTFSVDTPFLVPEGKDLLLYIVDFYPTTTVANTVDVGYILRESAATSPAPPGTWTPATPGGLQLWMDSGRGVRYDGSYVVSSWEDQSTNNYAATGSVAGATAPVLDISNADANNLPTITFDGAELNSDYLALPNSSVISIAYPLTVFAVVDPGRAGLRDGLFTCGTDGDEFALNVRTSKINVYASTFGENTDTLSDTEIPAGFNVIGITITNDEGFGSTMQYYLNGSTDGSYSVGNSTAIVGTARVLGGDSVSFQHFKGDIAEIVVYNGILGASDLSSLNTYFNDKYDL